MKSYLNIQITSIFIIFVLGFAQEIYEVPPVVVTANRYPKDISEITRTVNIIDATEIIKHSSLVEVLKNITSLYTKIRGDGIQADPSIREEHSSRS
jgi:outer membrane cobalamin receptor